MRLLLTTAAALGVCVASTAPARSPALDPGRVAPAAPAWAGVVEGTVQLGGAKEPAPAMLSPYARRRYSPPVAASGGSGQSEDVVVYVLVDRGAPPAKGREVTTTQRDLTILPHVTAVQVGTRVHFPNEDDVFHNLFSLSSAHRFNLGRYPEGDSRSEVFERAGVVRMFCDIHSEMSGVILVLDTPHFTRADADGRFRITGLPAGRHRVVAWHEAAGADTVEVVLRADGKATAHLRLTR